MGMQVVKIVIGAALLGYGAVALYLFLMQSRLVFHPHRTLEATPADAGLGYEDLRLPTGEGGSGRETIHAWFVPAPQARGTVLFCHGNAGNISHRLETLAILHRLGMQTLIFDYQGYGESTGSPSEQGTYQDAEACWNWLVQNGHDPASIVIMGRSLGGAVAAWAAAEHPDCAGLVLESTFTSVPDMGAGMYPWLPVRALSRISYDTRARLERIRCPILVAHSPEDDVVPYALGRELFETSGAQASFLELTGGHNHGYLLTGVRYEAGLDRFFQQVFPQDR